MNDYDLKILNRKLTELYGRHSDYRPNWRLVENNKSLTEKRYGTFGKFDPHGNYLGEETRVKEVPKYNYIPEGIYILEQLMFGPLPFELDMATISNNGTYEPRWPFMTNDFEYLEPTLEGCEFIIKCIQMTTKGRPKRNEKDEARKRIANDRVRIDNEIPELANALVKGSAIKLDPTKVVSFSSLPREVPGESKSNS